MNQQNSNRNGDVPKNGKNERNVGNTPPKSQNSKVETCNCDDICRPATAFNNERSSLNNRSNFSPGVTQNLMNSELNNSLFHPNNPHNDRSAGAQQTTLMEKENLLIEDTYDPGLIEDSVECRKDFNAVSFGLFFESIQHIPKQLPPKTPMSLLEAFHKRIDYERNHLLDATSFQKENRKLSVQSVETFFSSKPKTNLNKALLNLYKAEALFLSQKGSGEGQTLNLADGAYNLDIKHTTQPLVGGSPITVETFIGTTTPKMKQSSANPKDSNTKESSEKKK